MQSQHEFLEGKKNSRKTKTVVQKFGGSSVATPERIKAVAKICQSTKEKENCNLLVVVSAMGQTTNQLEDLLGQIVGKERKKDLSADNLREKDLLLSSGEQISTALLSLTLQENKCPSTALTGWQAGIQTTAQHTRARIKKIDLKTIEQIFEKDQVRGMIE